MRPSARGRPAARVGEGSGTPRAGHGAGRGGRNLHPCSAQGTGHVTGVALELIWVSAQRDEVRLHDDVRAVRPAPARPRRSRPPSRPGFDFAVISDHYSAVARRAGPLRQRLVDPRRRGPGDRADRADDLRHLPDPCATTRRSSPRRRRRWAALRAIASGSGSGPARTSTSTSSAAAGRRSTRATRCSARPWTSSRALFDGEYVQLSRQALRCRQAKLWDLPDQRVADRRSRSPGQQSCRAGRRAGRRHDRRRARRRPRRDVRRGRWRGQAAGRADADLLRRGSRCGDQARTRPVPLVRRSAGR